VSPMRYELGFYIPEDGVLHSHRRENLNSLLGQLFLPSPKSFQLSYRPATSISAGERPLSSPLCPGRTCCPPNHILNVYWVFSFLVKRGAETVTLPHLIPRSRQAEP
jgi:hypothetical protein